MARGANPKQRLSAPGQSQRPRLSPPAGPSRQLRTPTRRRRVPVHRRGGGGPCQASCRLLSPAGAAQVSPPAPPLPGAQCGAASRLAPGSCCFPARVPPLRRGRTRTWPGRSLPRHRCPKHETRAIPPPPCETSPGTSRSSQGAGDRRPPCSAARGQSRPDPCSTMSALLKSLVGASEKSARIAQLCRQEEALFQLLIEEKTGTDKNKKFVQDFKTLADVLIQEVIKHDVGKEFPELHGHICGEESNKFENSLGETLVVQVCTTQRDTASLLFKILDRNQPAAELLAAAIHQEVVLQDPALDTVALAIPPERLAIWIDPIDSTNQYIRGQASVAPIGGICPSGLRSALVLIGAYDRSSGDPVLGVINEPFFREDPLTHRWQGVYHWGVSYQGTSLCSLSRPPLRPEPSVVLSRSETPAIQRVLRPLYGERLLFASGAGYKMLCVILGLAEAYVLSEGSTFKWDSCAPHAILRALGGGMVDLEAALQAWRAGQRGALPELTYSQPAGGAVGAERWANRGGLVAFMHREHLEVVLATLATAAL
ncbi:unnamed protein product [Lepidochelys olivacea]